MHDQGAEASAGSGDAAAQWQARVVDNIDDVVTTVHERVIRPLLLVARAVVFGILVATMTLVVGVLFCIAVIRLLDVYLFRDRVWASDALVGGLLAVLGIFLWTRRRGAGAP
jgi:hypothetical protein